MLDNNVLKGNPVEAEMRVEARMHAVADVMASCWFKSNHEYKK
jgi:hypothetical protein